MSESYQAIYDAVRSRIGNGNVGDAVERVASRAFDISHVVRMLEHTFAITADEMRRPSVLWRPAVYPDGTKWCALYGDDPQRGVAGFGDTPAEAMADFDMNWLKQRATAGEPLGKQQP